MRKYDVIVLGTGVALPLAFKAAEKGMKVALIDRGEPGGTCLNVGCVPSKMLIYPADLAQEIRESRPLGLRAQLRRIDFGILRARMLRAVREGRRYIRRAIRDEKNVDWYPATARFVGLRTLQAGARTLQGKIIFIGTGSRPSVPSLRGLAAVDYLTNESVLGLRRLPRSLIIIGGGYIGVEYAHFFSAMGSKVTILQSNPRLVPSEEPEISTLLAEELRRRMSVRLDAGARRVRREGDRVAVFYGSASRPGGARKVSAERLLVAAGRRSNADLLQVERGDIETDTRGYIKVNAYLETSAPGVYALGDAVGRQMFTHAGDREAKIAWANATGAARLKMDFNAVPHAVFTRPPIAAVGLTEEEARRLGPVLVGRATYADTVKGAAMGVREGFAKAVVNAGNGRLVGFHLIGPEAPVLIQEAVNVLARRLDLRTVTETMHIFPALSELIPDALEKLEPPPPSREATVAGRSKRA